MRQSLLFPWECVNTPQAYEKPGSDSLTSDLMSTGGPGPGGAQLSPEAEAGGAAAEKAGTKLPGARQSHLNLTGFGSAWTTGRSGSHRMWFSKGGEVYALTSNDSFFS